jgi:hypothetical protein
LLRLRWRILPLGSANSLKRVAAASACVVAEAQSARCLDIEREAQHVSCKRLRLDVVFEARKVFVNREEPARHVLTGGMRRLARLFP